MKKYLLGLFAVALAVGFSAFTTSSKKVEVKKGEKAFLFSYYYEFKGTPGQEDQESLWDLLPNGQSDFENSPCANEINGCVIETASSSSTAPTHPALVPVVNSGSLMTPDIDGTNITDAKFKNVAP